MSSSSSSESESDASEVKVRRKYRLRIETSSEKIVIPENELQKPPANTVNPYWPFFKMGIKKHKSCNYQEAFCNACLDNGRRKPVRGEMSMMAGHLRKCGYFTSAVPEFPAHTKLKKVHYVKRLGHLVFRKDFEKKFLEKHPETPDGFLKQFSACAYEQLSEDEKKKFDELQQQKTREKLAEFRSKLGFEDSDESDTADTETQDDAGGVFDLDYFQRIAHSKVKPSPLMMKYWEFFHRGRKDYQKSHDKEAYCKACWKATRALQAVRGNPTHMNRHLKDCKYLTPEEKQSILDGVSLMSSVSQPQVPTGTSGSVLGIPKVANGASLGNQGGKPKRQGYLAFRTEYEKKYLAKYPGTASAMLMQRSRIAYDNLPEAERVKYDQLYRERIEPLSRGERRIKHRRETGQAIGMGYIEFRVEFEEQYLEEFPEATAAMLKEESRNAYEQLSEEEQKQYDQKYLEGVEGLDSRQKLARRYAERKLVRKMLTKGDKEKSPDVGSESEEQDTGKKKSSKKKKKEVEEESGEKTAQKKKRSRKKRAPSDSPSGSNELCAEPSELDDEVPEEVEPYGLPQTTDEDFVYSIAGRPPSPEQVQLYAEAPPSEYSDVSDAEPEPEPKPKRKRTKKPVTYYEAVAESSSSLKNLPRKNKKSHKDDPTNGKGEVEPYRKYHLRSCSVRGCLNWDNGFSEIIIYEVSGGDRAWIDFCNQPSYWQFQPGDGICSTHFTKSDNERMIEILRSGGDMFPGVRPTLNRPDTNEMGAVPGLKIQRALKTVTPVKKRPTKKKVAAPEWRNRRIDEVVPIADLPVYQEVSIKQEE